MDQGALLKQAIEAFSKAAAVSVESLSGTACDASPAVGPTAEPAIPADQRELGWQAKLGEGAALDVLVLMNRQKADLLGGFILQAAGLEDQDQESLKATVFEVLSQAVSGWSQKLADLLGEKVEIQTSGECKEGIPGLTYFLLQLNFDEKTFEAYLGVRESFFAKAPPPPLPAAMAAAVASSPSSSPFELLLDVDLPVSISFGRALVPLKEILKLNSGSIVELDRAVTEPVEVIVNNCVIARGEVVVVEGNYGVRIQQIISRNDRLKTMR